MKVKSSRRNTGNAIAFHHTMESHPTPQLYNKAIKETIKQSEYCICLCFYFSKLHLCIFASFSVTFHGPRSKFLIGGAEQNWDPGNRGLGVYGISNSLKIA